MKACAIFPLFRVCLTGLCLALAFHAGRADTIPTRPLKICVAADAPAPVQECAREILAAIARSPLLSLLAAQGASVVDSAKLLGDPSGRAYAHLILVGLPTDPLIQVAWQKEARLEASGIYLYDFGHFTGSLGYLESDRNPFLHSPIVKIAPYEAETITITGTTPEGVMAATRAFLDKGLVNGIVVGGLWQRPGTTLLDRDPLPANFSLPAFVPAHAGDAVLLAVTQAGESEYRGVLQDAGVEPREIWRFKYYLPGAWDGAGADQAMAGYLAGLHRRAPGHTLWAARFTDAMEATAALPKIARAAHLHASGQIWNRLIPTDPAQPLTLWQRQDWLLMSTLKEVNPGTVP